MSSVGLVALRSAAVSVCLLLALSAVGCVQSVRSNSTRTIVHSAELDEGSVRLSFIGHATLLIETPDGASAVTDYAGQSLPSPPDVATMSNDHAGHSVDTPDPSIGVVLRGWDPAGGTAHTVRDLRVWGVPISNGSIFAFEAGGVRIAHLGQVRGPLSDQQLSELGRMDILLVPIDETETLSHAALWAVIAQIGQATVIPMHYAGWHDHHNALSRFLDMAERRGYETFLVGSGGITLIEKDMWRGFVMVLGDL